MNMCGPCPDNAFWSCFLETFGGRRRFRAGQRDAHVVQCQAYYPGQRYHEFPGAQPGALSLQHCCDRTDGLVVSEVAVGLQGFTHRSPSDVALLMVGPATSAGIADGGGGGPRQSL